MKNALVFGAGGQGRVIADIIECNHSHNILGFLDDAVKIGTRIGTAYEVLGDRFAAATLCNANTEMFIAVGDNWSRAKLIAHLKELNRAIVFGTAVHPSACIARGVKIGVGASVMAGATINVDSVLGQFCIINTQASIDHDCTIGDFASVLPGAVLGGNVNVGEFSVVALKAGIIHQINIGAHSVIGAGATVVNDVPSFSVAYGNPAKVVRSRKQGESYL